MKFLGMLNYLNFAIATGFSVKGNITGDMAADGAFSTTQEAIKGAGNSVIYILMMIVGFTAVIGLLIAVMKIMVGGASTKNEAKGSLFWILIAGIIGFGAMGIVGLLQTIGLGLFEGSEAGESGMLPVEREVLLSDAGELADHFMEAL